MQVVCEATQNPAVSVQVGAFECLVRIMGMYYAKMEFYMERALFGVGFKYGSWLTSVNYHGYATSRGACCFASNRVLGNGV